MINVCCLQIVFAQVEDSLTINHGAFPSLEPINTSIVELHPDARIIQAKPDAEDNLIILARDTLAYVDHYSLSFISASGIHHVLKEWRHTTFDVRDLDIFQEDVYLLTSNESEWYPQHHLLMIDLEENTTEAILLNFPSYDFYPISIKVTSQDSLFVLTTNAGTGNYTIFNFNMIGETLWNYTSSRPGIRFSCLGSGQLVVLDNESLHLINSEGNLEWTQSIGPPTDSSTANWFVNSILPLEDDSILISFNMYVQGSDRILRFASNGSLIWSESIRGSYSIGGISDTRIDTMFLSSNNSIFVVADVFGTDYNPVLVCLSEDGTLYSGWKFNSEFLFPRLMADSQDNPILLGIEHNQYNSTLYVYHYDPSTALPPSGGSFYLVLSLAFVGVVCVLVVFFAKQMAKKETSY